MPRVLLDANVSLLFVVGTVDSTLLAKVKRTKSQSFEPRDYKLLLSFTENATLVTTPHILAEVSNLSAQGVEGARFDAIREALRIHCQVVDERAIPASAASNHVVFGRLGLTDAAIALLAQQEPLTVITTDLDLWAHLRDTGIEAVNFTHWRQQQKL